MKKTILIVGCTSFVGFNLISKLANIKRFKIICTYRKNKKFFTNFKNVSFIKLDLSKKKEIFKIKKLKPNYIFFLASSDFQKSNNLNYHISQNLLNSFNFFSEINYSKLEKVIFSSSGAVYGSGRSLSEKSKIKNELNYGFIKYLTEKMILFFSKKNNFDVVIFRIFSLYGRFDKNKRFFVDAIRSFLNKKKFIIKTKNQERDYLFVDDAVNAFIKALEFKGSDIFNLGSGKSVMTFNIANKIKNLINNKKKLKIIYKIDKKQNIISHYTAKVDYVEKKLNWKAEVKLDDGIKKVYEWIKYEKY